VNLRNFQTQLNEAANKVVIQNNDRDPQVIVIGQNGQFDLDIDDVFVSELDGKVVIRLREVVKPLGRVRAS
jgi:hypothetical protein